MSEVEDKPPPNTQDDDSFSWLVTQNKELRDHNKKVEKELYEWKLNASETNERLSRVYQNRDKKNYVDSFYDSNIKRLIKSLLQENVILKNELSIKDISNSTTKLLQQRNTIEALKDKLETKCQENKQLKNLMENLECSDAITELKRNISDLHKKITVENTDLKNHMKNHNEIMTYLKSEFGKQRKEFIKVFAEHYLHGGDLFIEQLKSLDGGEIPEFLTKPLDREIGPSTNELIDSSVPAPKTNLFDSNKDSGIESLPEVFQDLMTTSQELEASKIKVTLLEEELRFKTKQDIKMKNSFSDEKNSLEYRIKMLEETVAKTQKELRDANADALAWKTAVSIPLTIFTKYCEIASSISKLPQVPKV